MRTGIRDRPGGAGLLALGREMLLDELLPLLPPERHRELRLVATAMAIAEREAAGRRRAGSARSPTRLAEFYGAPASSRQEGRQDAGAPDTSDLLARFAARPARWRIRDMRGARAGGACDIYGG